MNFISNWSLNKKFMANIALLAFGAAWLAGLGIHNMQKVQSTMAYVNVELADRIALINEINTRVHQLALDESDFLLNPNHDEMVKNEKEILDNKGKIDELVKKHTATTSADGSKIVAAYSELFKQWSDLDGRIRKLGFDGKHDEAVGLVNAKVGDFRDKISGHLDELLTLNSVLRAKAIDEENENYVSTRNQTILISLLSIGISCLIAAWVLRGLSKSINEIIENLENNSTRVRSTAQQIAASSSQLSHATTEQAASLEETAASIEEMSAMVQKNSENARNSSHSSTKSEEKANHGQAVVKDMISSINAIETSNRDIMTQVTESNQQISEITKVIADIGNKTKVINDIVFQTKLLSFNASVEAARAGEHGKGFAVVAEEIGNLAQMSGNAAKEISTMLETSIQSVESIVKQTREKVEHLIQAGSEKVQTGTRVARQCGDVLAEIVGNVSQVATMVNEISAASQEQAQGVLEINKAIGSLGQVTQENAATSEESAKSAEELSGQADSLREVLNSLVHTIRGGGSQAAEGGNENHGPTSHSNKKSLSKRTSKKTASRNVLPFKKAATPKHDSHRAEPAFAKKAVGAEDAVPAQDDPRFEEI